MRVAGKCCAQCSLFHCCRRRVCFQALIVFMVLVTIVYYITTDSSDIPIHKKHNFLPSSVFTRIFSTATNSTTKVSNPKATSKLVLLWFPFFSKEPQLWTLSQGSLDDCPVKNCISTTDHSKLLESDAVVIHISHPHMDVHYPVLPQTRHPQQRWVLFTMEPPQHIKTHLSFYNNVFNWTATFRTDSDVPVYYGAKEQHNRTDTSTKYIYKNHTILEKEKPRLVAWIASNFVARSNRMRLVRELQQHITVDVYGSVSSLFKHNNLPCVRHSPQCDQLLHQYKFYISLENNNCRDYITEKFWDAIERGSIPVVMGGEWYKNQAPPSSYIDIRNFSSIKSLAKYLIKVANDVDLFNSYMQWRYKYRVVGTKRFILSRWGCDLCKALNNPALPAQVYSDLSGWYAEDEISCSTFSIWERSKRILNVLFFRLGF